jgi:hypothetical protein
MSEGKDDLLRQAARALRDETRAVEDDAAGAPEAWRGMDGWSEIARDVRQAARRRRLLIASALQLVLVLSGLGAWAAVSGRLPALLFTRRAPAPAPSAPAEHARRAGHRTPAAPVSVAEAPAPAEAPPPPVVPAPAPPASPPPRPPLPSPRRVAVRATGAPGVAAPAPVDPDTVYREAHTAQFVRRDYAAALAAWDRYLALGPQSFTPEARYNRAIALVRLQRRDEAAAALHPFADGDYGGYRAEEAKGLLRLLGEPP